MARKDKTRYEMEKSMYTGPWKVPAKKRSNKDPNAPKRPMSAFLSFSNSKRTLVKENHPDAGNAEVSRILAQMWKDASAEERKEHVDQEFKLRQEYKLAIAEWKENSETEIETVRKERDDEAMNAALHGRPLGPQEHEPFRNDGRMIQHHPEGRLDPSADYNDLSYPSDQPFYHQAQPYMEAVPPYYPPQHHYQHYHQQHHYHHMQYYNNDHFALPPPDGGGYPLDHSGCYPPGAAIEMVHAAAAGTGYQGGTYFDGSLVGQQQHYHPYPQHQYPANNAYDAQQTIPLSHTSFQQPPHADKSQDEATSRNPSGKVYESGHNDPVEGHHHICEDGGPRTSSATFVPPYATYQHPQDPYGNQNYYYYGGGAYHSSNIH